TDDLTTASAAELARLDPASIADAKLAAAFESADGLRDDRLTERFAAELAARTPEARLGVELTALIACLVRGQLSRGEFHRALELIERLKPEAAEVDRRRLDVWRAEILARDGRGDEAAALYRGMLDLVPSPAILA